MRLSLLLLLIAAGNTNVDAFPEGFFTKLTNFFRKKPTPPPTEVSTYQRYDSPDEDLFSNVHSEVNPLAPCPPGQVYVDEAGACMTVQYPGQPCQYSQQCSGVEEGAFCSRLRCECAHGMTISGGSCVFSNHNCRKHAHVWIEELGECKQVILPGSTGCSHSSQCSTAYAGTYCFHQTCTCPPPLHPVDGTCGERCFQGHTYSSITGECLPSVLPGEKCLYSSQCNAMQVGTVCKRGRCRCADGLVFSGTQCAKVCPKGFTSNRFGLCRPDCTQSQVEHEGDCYDKMGAGQRCQISVQCLSRSTCIDGICKCPANMIIKSGSCYPKEVLPLDSCAGGEQCSGGSYCSNGKCVCPPGTKVVNGQCITPITVGPGENCLRADVKCNEGSICMSGVCACMTGTILRGGKCRTHVAANPGESCGRGERCEGESFCNRNLWKCVCPMEMIKIGNKCHPRLKSAPGFPCNNGEICIGGSYCQDDTCVCAPSQVRQKRQCVARKRVAAGSRCTSADICVGLSHCIGGFCQCEDGRIERRGECATILKALPGDPCSNGEECVGGSKCVGGLCSCPGHMIVYEKECRVQPTSQPGLPCGHGEKCIGGSFCDYDRKICSCPSGFSVTQGICQPPIDAMTIDIQAVELTWNTVPSQTSSTAVTSTVNTPSKPTMISRYATEANRRANLLLETSTQRYTSRRSESSTLGQTTSAVSGRERLHHTTHSTRSIQPGRCRTDEECSGGTQCAQGYCLCPVHQIMNDGHCQSATTEAPKPKVATVSRPCVASNQCADGAECISGVCRCPEGTVDSRHGFCIPLKTAHPLMSCMEGQPCGGGSACANGICVCPEGRRYIINNTCVPPVGEQQVVVQRGRDDRVRRPQAGIQRCPTDGSCQLPDCYCSRTGMEIPGGYSAAEVPQMVIITFDDPVTDHSIKIFKSIFNGRFRNPNGCPIKATFFVSHEWNNYDQSQWLMGNGHEIAVGSMTGDALRGESSERWHAEMVGMRDALRLFSYVPGNEIIGVRAPHLETGGDRQFSMMTSSGFAYDSTIAVSGGPYWPQTLDFTLAWGCSEEGCPRMSHHGLWEIPISRLTRGDHRNQYTTLKDALRTGDLPDDIADMLEKNFQQHYKYNRAPFVVAIDTEYLNSLQDSGAVSALEMFISKVLQNPDTYIVSASQALRWLQLPTRLAKIHNFTAWQCNQRTRHHILPCENPSTCTFTCDRGEAHAFRICGSCPRAYPKLGDPTGSGNVTVVN